MKCDYRKLYEEVHHIKIPKGYEIHHIDFNHENNDILNLVMLPVELHKELHKVYDKYMFASAPYSLDHVFICSGRATGRTYFLQCLSEYLCVLRKCIPYMNNSEYELMESMGVDYVYR